MQGKITQGKVLVIFFSLLMVFLGGCTYQWLTSPSQVKIAIPVFINDTFQYGLEETLTNLVKEQFLLDGRQDIVEEEGADLILRGKITRYFNEPLSEAGVAVEYKVRIDIEVSLYSTKDEKILGERSLSEETSYSSIGMTTTEEEAVRETAGELGEELVDLVNSLLEG